MVIVTFFLIWAPLFCVFENYAPQEERDSADEDDERRMEDSLELMQSFFTSKLFWEFGYARSVNFTSRNTLLTFQVLLLIWSADLVPRFLLTLVASPQWEFIGQVLFLAISGLLHAIAIGAAVGTFLLEIPKRAKKEIHIENADPSSILETDNHIKIQSRVAPYVFMFIASCLSLMFVHLRSLEKNDMPSSVVFEFISAEIKRQQFVTRFRLDDPYDKFRWLDVGDFRVNFQGVKFNVSNQFGEKTTTEFLSPDAVHPFLSDGTPLPEQGFVPLDKALELVLYFNLPKELDAKGEFLVEYAPRKDAIKTIYRGRYGSSW